jgi:hypothetical protein
MRSLAHVILHGVSGNVGTVQDGAHGESARKTTRHGWRPHIAIVLRPRAMVAEFAIVMTCEDLRR